MRSRWRSRIHEEQVEVMDSRGAGGGDGFTRSRWR